MISSQRLRCRTDNLAGLEKTARAVDSEPVRDVSIGEDQRTLTTLLVAERTHRFRSDRDWLPPRVRRASTLVTTAAAAGTGAIVVGAVVAAPVTLFFWKGLLLGGAGLALATDRARKAMLHRQLRRMARGEVDLADLRVHEEGEMVVVQGTIEAEPALRGILIDTPGVFRRMVFSAGGTWVHEAAINFSLRDDAGRHIFVQSAGARWLVPAREKVLYRADRFTHEGVHKRVRELVVNSSMIEAYEQVLGVGERVQIVGYKTATADASGDVSDYRSPPTRATLRSGPDLPLVISRLVDLD